MDPLFAKNLKRVRAEGERYFFAKAAKLGFNPKQAYFLWHYVLTTESRKKVMNLLTGLQTEKDFKM